MNENIAFPGPVKRKLKRKFVRALNKMKSFEEKIIMRDKVNQVIGSSPTKLWYEIITNVPNGTEEVIFDLNLTKEGLQVVYKQDSFGPTFETFTQNSINDDIIQDGKLTLIDKKNSSSVYGSGFVTIGQTVDTTPMIAIYAGSGHVGSGTGGNRTKGHTGLGYWYIQSASAQDEQYGFFQCPINYLWAANTTSQQTIKLQMINGDSTNAELYINRSRRGDNSDWLGSSTSNLTIQEIKG